MSKYDELKSENKSDLQRVKALCAGDEIVFYGLRIRAIEVTGGNDPCEQCAMGSLCRYEMASLCRQCDEWAHKDYRLDLIDACFSKEECTVGIKQQPMLNINLKLVLLCSKLK